MQAALDQFDQNMTRARELVALSEHLRSLTTSAVDVSDLLRASLVLGVSALDHFVHEFVRLGMLSVHRGLRPATDAHLAFRITVSHARVALSDVHNDDWLDQAVRDAHGWQSFQHPEKVADALRLVSSVSLWETVAADLGATAKHVKAQLASIVDRRNKIAHEADMDATNPGYRWPITAAMVLDALGFVERVAHSIYRVA